MEINPNEQPTAPPAEEGGEDEPLAGNRNMNFPHHFGRYSFTRVIGHGAYGVVIAASDSSSTPLSSSEYAVKVVSRRFLQETGTFFAFEQELRVHQLLDHPNIIKISEVIYENDFVFIVMELCSKGDLFSYISEEGPLNVTTIRNIFFQILLSVQYLHKREIAHLDLKPDNILVTKDIEAKLGDFGCCEAPPKRQNYGGIGTLYYAAPEILTRKHNDNLPADIWSLGIILFAMTTGSLPWLPGTDDEICQQILRGDLTMPHDLPSNVYKIIYKCCQVNREERPKIDELIEDPWFEIERHKLQLLERKRRNICGIMTNSTNGTKNSKMNQSMSLKQLQFQQVPTSKRRIDVRGMSIAAAANNGAGAANGVQGAPFAKSVTGYNSMPRISMYNSQRALIRGNRSRAILKE